MSDSQSLTPRHKLGILVVDDERSLCNMLETVLRLQGFTVWTAVRKQEALDLYKKHSQQIGLVLLDVRIPGEDGPQILRTLQGLNPYVVCCFMSGDTGPYREEDLLELGAIRVLHKPFSLTDLVQLCWHLPGVEERRKVPRQEDQLKVAIAEPPFSGKEITSWLRNRSSGGLGIWLSQPAPIHTRLSVRIADASQETAWTQVEVKYCQPLGDGWAVGCQVLEMSPGEN